ncbi:MAG: DNRLRE domain-containing protein [Planctomycetes bacterium]|nr:DNRLRE domain-containing protein [Planctomycetota bacterium]
MRIARWMTQAVFVMTIGGALATTHAAPVVTEAFSDAYTEQALINGQTANGAGLTGAWATTTTSGQPDTHAVGSSGLGYFVGNRVLLSTDGSLTFGTTGSASDRVSQASLASYTPTAGDLYFSGIVSAPSGTGFAMWRILDNVTTGLSPGDFGIQFGVNAGNVRIRARTTGGVSNTDFNVATSFVGNQNMFFVIKVEQNVSGSNDRVSVWLNPSNLGSEAAAGTPTFTTLVAAFDQTTSNRAVDNLSVRTVNYTGTSWAGFDEFRMAGSWAEAVPSQKMIAFKTVADTYVQADGSSGGSSQILAIKNASTLGFSRKIYSRFDLSSIDESMIKDARLSLTMDLAGGSSDMDQTHAWVFNVYGLKDGDAGESWNESTLTWATAPGNDTASGDGVLSGNTTLLGSFIVTGSERLNLMLTADELPGLVDFLKANLNGLATLIITRDTAGDGVELSPNTVHGIRSREYDIANGTNFAMTLLVTVPTPAALPAGLALMGLARLRRRGRADKTASR